MLSAVPRRAALSCIAATLFLGTSIAADQPRFEVATVKPIDPNAQILMGAHVYPGGRITISGVSLKGLIVTAFAISGWQISGGDPWTSGELYNVEAKPSEAMQASIHDLRFTLFAIEDPTLREMLQALLIDRFQLAFHRETKTGDVYALEQTGKPLRMRPSETPSRPANPFGSIGYAGGQWNIYATSMPQLAKFASDIILHTPVLDRTNLTGSYDYRQRIPDAEPKYSGDQTDSFTAYLQELGLKLSHSKGPIEIFILDHAAKPSPN